MLTLTDERQLFLSSSGRILKFVPVAIGTQCPLEFEPLRYSAMGGFVCLSLILHEPEQT